MKAYTVTDRNGDEGYCIAVFAETRGKALSYAARDDKLCDYGYTGLRASRCPSLDKYYTEGKKEMDWLDDADRIAMVKDANFTCGSEWGCIDGRDCPAYDFCDYGQGLTEEQENEDMTWDIYEEGFRIMGESAKASYVGEGKGKTFLDACKDYISKTGRGKIQKDECGKEYASNWGCRWYPTLSEAQENFG